jgi:hypothetical protein
MVDAASTSEMLVNILVYTVLKSRRQLSSEDARKFMLLPFSPFPLSCYLYFIIGCINTLYV